MADQWATVDTCDKCGQTATLMWVGIESYGHRGYSRIDTTEIDCPGSCRWTITELNQAYRGRHGA